MAQPSARAYLAFLYRSETGLISRKEWWLGVSLLLGLLFLFELGWLALAPQTERGLEERALVDPWVLVTYCYVIVFALVFALCGISFITLSIKRLRAIGRPQALAGLVPLIVFLTSALHWLQPRVSEVMDRFWVWGMDGVLILCLIWTCVELGIKQNDRPEPN
ncbi:MAG: hypothetical protein EBY21_07460 [Alphaproteobacteria bacterium]|nr:hypothetical protein [Alphaproteobacteria bacterium]